jgi:tetratricopeptide (TPR) repeat protein
MPPANSLSTAVSAFQQGDFARARREAEAALRSRPGDPNVLQLLGVIQCQDGDLVGGTERFRTAMRRGADTADLRLNLARALLEIGELEEAETLCAAAPGRPVSRELDRMHADVLKAQGRLWEAISAYERLVEDQSGDFESWNNLGNARHDAGDYSGALSALEKARALNPQSATIHTNGARVLASMGRHEDGLLLFQEAVRLEPGNASRLFEFGKALRRIGQAREALVPLATSARLDQANAETFVEIGLAFTELADLRQAEQSYRVALKVRAGFGPALLNLGILLEQSNRVEELVRLVEDATGAGAGGGELNYLHALVAWREGRFEDALNLAREADTPALDPAVRAHFIGQVADRLGQIDVAFAAFEEMNRAAADALPDGGAARQVYLRDVERLAATTTKAWFDSWSPWVPAAGRPSPVFLVGFPWSSRS